MPILGRLAVLASAAASVASGQDYTNTPYWGAEVGWSAVPGIGPATDAVHSRYSPEFSGNTVEAGLVRFHASGSPNFSVRLAVTRLTGTATDNLRGARLSGSTVLTGVMFTKYASVFTRKRVSAGFAFGAGLAPRLEVGYEGTYQWFQTGRQTYRLEELAVTPLFDVLARADFRLNRHISVGPYGGIRDGLVVIGAMLRVHFLR